MILAATESLLNLKENIHNCFFIRSKNAIIFDIQPEPYIFQ